MTDIDDATGLPSAVANASLTESFDTETMIRVTALTMAIKYFDCSTIKDGTMYQQLKLDNKPIKEAHHNTVMETAIQFERYLRGDYAEMANELVGGDFELWLKEQVEMAGANAFISVEQEDE